MTKAINRATAAGQLDLNKHATGNVTDRSTKVSTVFQAETGASVFAPQQTETYTSAYALPMKPQSPFASPPKPHIGASLPRLTRDMLPKSSLMDCLYRALTSRRAAGSMSEAKFVSWLACRLPVTMIDGAGNLHIDTREGPQHRTLITAHTDTVHRQGGTNVVHYDATDPACVKLRAGEGHCLGADDGAGVALAYHMIVNGFKGYAILFRDEESGGVGSQWLANNMPHTLKDLDRCVSLDRAGYHDIITHQAGGRCCSNAFADALAAALTTDDMAMCYAADDTGVFTDSANLTGLIGECTNVSIAYSSQHGDGEWQDVTYLELLADQLVRVQWDDLPVVRMPGEDEVWGTKWTNVHGANAPSEQDAENYLIDALYAAEDEDFAALRGIVSEWINPEKPEESLMRIDPRRMRWGEYRDLADALAAGHEFYESVLTALVDNLVTN